MPEPAAKARPDPAVPSAVAVLVLKGTVLFPLQVASVQIASRENLRLLEDFRGRDAVVAAGMLIEPDGPRDASNLSTVAVACRILDRIPMGSTTQVVLQGLARIRLGDVSSPSPYMKAEATALADAGGDLAAVSRRVDAVLELIETLVGIDERCPDELLDVARLNAADGSRCADLVADSLGFSYGEKRRIVEAIDVAERLALLVEMLQQAVARARVAGELKTKTESAMASRRREAFLREQLAVIRRELEELDPVEADIASLVAKLQASPLPPLVAEEARREVERLHDDNLRAREGASIRAYVDWVLAMPWDAVTKDRLDQRRARQILDGRYFSLGTARKRLLEYLAVWKLTGRNVPPILCIMGPSGTGRTSLARTVADILGRSFVHIPLGGIQDEGEIRGLARTEVAARPGRILEGIRRAGSRNPVILFENVGGGSTPLPALLEAIDPTLNASFRDRYLGIPFDLSETLFIFTANVEDDVPESLTDFVYAIELSGYTEYVKLDILRDRLWPQALADHGLAGRGIRFTKAAQRRVIREYTREAGVRELKRQLGTICRRLALSASAGVAARVSIDARNLGDFLGKPVYRDDLVGRKPQVGVTTGLAWTEDGGDLLPIEALLMPGDGQIILTGLLGEVMEESVEAALSYVRSRSAELGIPDDIFSDKDLHVHFPEGAIPKDGPSAGITVATTLASLLSGRPVRHDLAMTGEISLRGRILPVGGIREKVLAAYRAKIRHVLLPKDNESDLATVPQEVLGKVRIHLVEQVSDVFRFALRPPETARARR